MKQTEESLLKNNRIAATIGQEEVIAILKQYREQFISTLKTIVPTNSDVYGINVHRALGRLDAIDFLISEGIKSTKRD